MKKGNKQVWKILTDDEKSSLLLSINYGKSTWQAGEIMNKAHYKYLEIQARANKYFKMFNEYFLATNNLRIPANCYINPFFRDYIIATVFERKNPKEAIASLDNSPFIVVSAKERIFNECLEQLANHEDPNQRLLHDLIREFDRWNNFRILPLCLQEPSAFKRRNKTRLVKHLKNLSTLDEFHIRRFIKKFNVNNSTGKKPLFIAVLSADHDEGYEVIRIANKKKIVEYISKHLRLYMYRDQVDADKFGYLVSRYLKDKEKDCKVGQKFWPMYRKNIELAHNYLDVNNIIPRRKHLEKAFRDLDEIHIRQKVKKAKEQKISDPQKRGETNNFWNI